MPNPATVIAPAVRSYDGGTTSVTRTERWATWVPNRGDILVCTPAKCGTTWTQTILAMLVHGGADLPAKLPVLSPWVDADLGVSASDVAQALTAQPGRRVVKTHAPADGFPVWDGVTVISVYRHPLDVFFSVRKHTANIVHVGAEDLMNGSVSQAFQHWLNTPIGCDRFDADFLASLAVHYTETALSGRLPGLKLFHYADMVRDGRRAVQALAEAAEIDADDRLIDRVTEATAFGAMKAKAADYAPVAGTGFWKSDHNFFDSASSRKWEGQLSDEELGLYRDKLATLVPDAAARAWLEHDEG